jgi:hypothetical protein
MLTRLLFVCILAIRAVSGIAHAQVPKAPKTSVQPAAVGDANTALVRLRAETIARIKEARAKNEHLLVLYQQERTRLEQEVVEWRRLHEQGVLARNELVPLEEKLAAARRNVEEVMLRIVEDEMAFNELSMRDELLRHVEAPKGAYKEDGITIRYHGSAPWSLADTPKIDGYFAQNFGKPLPVSAYGQSRAHDRLRLDHRDALDVALHPDSAEGKMLIAFLRRAGIPFIAFRRSLPGASTGAHIHIGNPSARH